MGDGSIAAVFTERSPENAKYVRMTSYVENGSTGIAISGKYIRPLENFTHLQGGTGEPMPLDFFKQSIVSDDFIYIDKYVDSLTPEYARCCSDKIPPSETEHTFQ